MQALDTNCVAENYTAMRHEGRVIGHGDLLSWLIAEREAKRLTNADLQRLLKLPSSRVSDIFSGERQIKLDEAKAIVEHYKLDRAPEAATISADALAPILAAVVPLAPQGELTDRFASILAEAVSYGLGLLPGRHTTLPSSDAIDVAARAAALRFRDLSLQ